MRPGLEGSTTSVTYSRMSTLLTVQARLRLWQALRREGGFRSSGARNEEFGAGRIAIFRKGTLPFADSILKGGHSVARVTVEDCLKKVTNQFELAVLGAKRAHQLIKGAKPLVESDNLPIVLALREIAAGKVRRTSKELSPPGKSGPST